MTTWRLESMWTRTLSTSISTSPSSMDRLSHGRRPGRPARPGPDREQDPGDDSPDQEPADVREHRNAAALDRTERRDPADQLEDEPEAEDDDRGHVDELVEEPEEDERRHPGAREHHEVRAERRGDRARRPDRRDRGRGVDGDLRQPRDHATEQVEGQEPAPA